MDNTELPSYIFLDVNPLVIHIYYLVQVTEMYVFIILWITINVYYNMLMKIIKVICYVYNQQKNQLFLVHWMDTYLFMTLKIL